MRPCRARLLTFVVCVLAAVVLLRQLERLSPALPLAPPDAAGAIVNGTVVQAKLYPWFVDFGGCGGTLIAPDGVLTANHCNIKVGSPVIIGGDEGRTVASISSADPLFDLKYIKLRTASKKKPIAIAKSRPPPGTPVLIMGRGRKTGVPMTAGTSGDRPFSIAVVKTVSREDAARMIEAESGPAPLDKANNSRLARMASVLTMVSSSKQACMGDSGGPVVLLPSPPARPDFQLIGVTFYGFHYCERDTQNKYSLAISLPDAFNLTKTIKGVRGQVSACMSNKDGYVDRRQVNGTWVCPADRPWDAGVWRNDLINAGQCSKTKACADSLHGLHATLGASTSPVRYVPG